MADLIDGFALVPVEVSVRINGIFFQEIADFVARRQEVIVADVIIITCRELGLAGRYLAFQLSVPVLL